jgi:hypothetical protein
VAWVEHPGIRHQLCGGEIARTTPRLQRAAEHLHRLGVRATHEVLVELRTKFEPEVFEQAEAYRSARPAGDRCRPVPAGLGCQRARAMNGHHIGSVVSFPSGQALSRIADGPQHQLPPGDAPPAFTGHPTIDALLVAAYWLRRHVGRENDDITDWDEREVAKAPREPGLCR